MENYGQYSPQLIKVIEDTIQELLTCEEEYFSASRDNINREKAQEILCEFIPQLVCEYHLRDILDQVYITKLLS